MKKNNFGNNGSNSNNFGNNGSNSNNYGNKEQDYQKAYEHYSNMNENDLMNKMYEMAKLSKSRGELDNSKLDQFYNNASGMLNAEQRKKLRNLLNLLKD